MSRVKIGIIGCLGRMGKALTAEVLEHDKAELIGATEIVGNEFIGKPIIHPLTGIQSEIFITTDTDELIKKADVVLDFTCPTATVAHANIASKAGTSLIVGTTGLSSADEEVLKEASKTTSIVYASNYSTGVNLMMHITKITANVLDEDFDIEIVEMHHRDKIDAPSGTALSIGKSAAKGRGKNLDDIKDSGRDGITNPRKRGDIGFASLRGGNVAGEHTVSFNADDERVEITHKAGDRSIFARGALKAALWVQNQKAGLYDMSDVLGL